ncbi:MAG: LD-carboxypeptidase [Acidobacteria bacterium]|nr:LD-carboxypeptidase [Acidobacteriota bacterium]
MNQNSPHSIHAISRRALGAFAAASAASAQAPAGQALLKPRALSQGDTVAVIMPSTHVPDPDRLANVKPTIEHFGLKLKPGRFLGKRTAAFTQSIDERIADLHEAFSDPAVKAVLPIGGGYGTMQILERIDYALIRRNPKIFTGYSDITAMHLAFQKFAGLVTFHSPVVLSPFTKYSQTLFRKALFEAKPIGEVANPPEANPLRPQHPWRAVRPGKVRAPIVGGNLTLVAHTMGTPYEIDTRGKIFFIEDVGEDTYAIDRMLIQLHLGGKLEQAAGIVWGECNDCGPGACRTSSASPFTLGETVDNIFARLKTPVLAGLTIGHTADQATLPLGVMATLDATAGTLTLEEPATTA